MLQGDATCRLPTFYFQIDLKKEAIEWGRDIIVYVYECIQAWDPSIPIHVGWKLAPSLVHIQLHSEVSLGS